MSDLSEHQRSEVWIELVCAIITGNHEQLNSLQTAAEWADTMLDIYEKRHVYDQFGNLEFKADPK